jgi:hypothetical protein
MKIRRGRAEDIKSVLPLFKKFAENHGFVDAGIRFSATAATLLLTRALSGSGVFSVAETEDGIVGYALANVVPFPFNPSATVMSELSVYGETPAVALALSKKVRQVGRQLGATAVCTADLRVAALT